MANELNDDCNFIVLCEIETTMSKVFSMTVRVSSPIFHVLYVLRSP